MAGLINELIDVLNKECVNYDELLALSGEKKRTIIENDVETLQKITIVESKIVARNGKLEQRRAELSDSIATVLNRDPKTLTLTLLAGLIETQAEHGELVAVTERLRDTITKLKELNDLNNTLLQSSLDYVEFTLNLVRGATDEKPSYHSSKNREVADERGFFDVKQ